MFELNTDKAASRQNVGKSERSLRLCLLILRHALHESIHSLFVCDNLNRLFSDHLGRHVYSKVPFKVAFREIFNVGRKNHISNVRTIKVMDNLASIFSYLHFMSFLFVFVPLAHEQKEEFHLREIWSASDQIPSVVKFLSEESFG